MHKQMRISLTHRRYLLQQDIAACDATIKHMEACTECRDDFFCPVGDQLYQTFILAKARAKLVTDTLADVLDIDEDQA
jgi:hypothetical protein